MLAPLFAVTTSSLPSPLTSPTATDHGAVPVAKSVLAPKPPVPLPSSTLTVLSLTFDVARSSLPSPLTSPTATWYGLAPVAKSVLAPKPPVPLPSSTLTVLAPWFAVTRSSLPSPLKSPTATDLGSRPVAIVGLGAEAAGAVAEQHADRVGADVGRHQVELAVAVEVADGHEGRLGAGGEVGLGGEAAETVAQQHADRVGALAFAVTRSSLPSPLKSPTATQLGPAPVAKSVLAVKPPDSSPSRTLTVLASWFAVTRSGAKLPLKSPMATDSGPAPVA